MVVERKNERERKDGGPRPLKSKTIHRKVPKQGQMLGHWKLGLFQQNLFEEETTNYQHGMVKHASIVRWDLNMEVQIGYTNIYHQGGRLENHGISD